MLTIDEQFTPFTYFVMSVSISTMNSLNFFNFLICIYAHDLSLLENEYFLTLFVFEFHSFRQAIFENYQ